MSLSANPAALRWLQAKLVLLLDTYLDEQHAEMMQSAGPIRKWWESIAYTQLKRQVQPFAAEASVQILDEVGPLTIEDILLGVIPLMKEKA